MQSLWQRSSSQRRLVLSHLHRNQQQRVRFVPANSGMPCSTILSQSWFSQQSLLHQNQVILPPTPARFHSSRRDVLDEDDDELDHDHDHPQHNNHNNTTPEALPWRHQRVWHAVTDSNNNLHSSPTYWTQSFLETSMTPSSTSSYMPSATSSLHDHDPVEFWASNDDHDDPPATVAANTKTKLTTAAASSTNTSTTPSAGRLRVRQLGVLDEDPVRDVQLLTENYTVPSLAIALRDREDVLQQCAELALQEDWNAILHILEPFQHQYVLERRQQHTIHHGTNNQKTKLGGILVLDQDSRNDSTHHTSSSSSFPVKPLDTNALELIRKALMRMPRQVIQAHTQRAGVVLPLCHVHGVPSLLLERRAAHLSSHPNEVCLPGGMICKIHDRTIVATCLREMREEIPAMAELDISVLGVLRCNWGDLHHLVGVAVTPVVCWLGDIEHVKFQPNPSEVSQVFTIPLHSLLDASLWRHQDGYAPVFVGGPYEIWGLTGYILERFAQDILLPHSSRDIVEALANNNKNHSSNNNNKN